MQNQNRPQTYVWIPANRNSVSSSGNPNVTGHYEPVNVNPTVPVTLGVYQPHGVDLGDLPAGHVHNASVQQVVEMVPNLNPQFQLRLCGDRSLVSRNIRSHGRRQCSLCRHPARGQYYLLCRSCGFAMCLRCYEEEDLGRNTREWEDERALRIVAEPEAVTVLTTSFITYCHEQGSTGEDYKSPHSYLQITTQIFTSEIESTKHQAPASSTPEQDQSSPSSNSSKEIRASSNPNRTYIYSFTMSPHTTSTSRQDSITKSRSRNRTRDTIGSPAFRSTPTRLARDTLRILRLVKMLRWEQKNRPALPVTTSAPSRSKSELAPSTIDIRVLEQERRTLNRLAHDQRQFTGDSVDRYRL
ncbi:hypothetical protein BJ508DRAFT_308798 [Ascobolus immersus RN42]|uniref:Uncharacterized protein n=1 Tax=Ascobolus immersus RN42 TaxID=1160509 RepID=A0A3N4I477_ASCIM|nr:hypothetical protein BJ508DRAFT_308798 [Ascobolus immersus RN42]